MKIRQIAIKNLKRQKTRTVFLIMLSSLLSITLLSSLTISSNLKNGIDTMTDRFGADLLVVPLQNDSDMENILLQGTPSEFYFDRTLLDKVKDIPGISRCTSQFYLQSLSASCCSSPTQLIGYDPETDFSVTPWISKVYDKDVPVNQIVIGSNISADASNQLKWFNRTYNVAAQLNETGTGLDNSVYVTMDGMKTMFEDAKAMGVEFKSDVTPETSISCILIDVEDSYDETIVMNNVYRAASSLGIDVKVIQAQSLTKELASNVKSLSVMTYIFSALSIMTSYVALYIIFSLVINERKKEFAVMRMLGATKTIISKLILCEALTMAIAGSVIGSVVSLVFTMSFSTYINASLSLPYIETSVSHTVILVIMNMTVCMITSILAVAATSSDINKAETFITMKEGE